MVVNKLDENGKPTAHDAPTYRVEFQWEDFFCTNTAVLEDDEDENRRKTEAAELQSSRGTKVGQVVKRVSGVLLQLSAYEIMSPQEMAWVKAQAERARLNQLKAIEEQATFSAEDVKGDKAKTRRERSVGRKAIDLQRAPKLRIIGYDPRIKYKASLTVSPEIITELAGGGFSPFLAREKRRDLVQLVCQQLFLIFPINPVTGKKKPDFSMEIIWTGMDRCLLGPAVFKEFIPFIPEKRPGKIFEAYMRIMEVDCLVVCYAKKFTDYSNVNSAPPPQLITPTLSDKKRQSVSISEAGKDRDTVDKEKPKKPKKYLDFNKAGKQFVMQISSHKCKYPVDLNISDEDQLLRIGDTVLSLPDGEVRDAAIRRLTNWIHARMAIGPPGDTKQLLLVDLLPVDVSFIGDYRRVGIAEPGANVRPVGLPAVFVPIDVRGELLHRQVLTRRIRLYNKDAPMQEAEYVTSIYTKSPKDTPDRGLVLCMYERSTSDTIYLHIGPAEVKRICEAAQEWSLLRLIKELKAAVDCYVIDKMEEAFVVVTEKGDMMIELRKHMGRLIRLIINEVAIMTDPQDRHVPYLSGARYKPV